MEQRHASWSWYFQPLFICHFSLKIFHRGLFYGPSWTADSSNQSWKLKEYFSNLNLVISYSRRPHERKIYLFRCRDGLGGRKNTNVTSGQWQMLFDLIYGLFWGLKIVWTTTATMLLDICLVSQTSVRSWSFHLVFISNQLPSKKYFNKVTHIPLIGHWECTFLF